MPRAMPVASCCFNPLPTQRPGETAVIAPLILDRFRFNPLPTQRPGETRRYSVLGVLADSFNPLPTQRPGETPT